MLDVMREIGLLSSGEAGAIGTIFSMMEIAEDEIEVAQLTYPEKREDIWNCFRLLVPGGIFNDLTPLIYRNIVERFWKELSMVGIQDMVRRLRF